MPETLTGSPPYVLTPEELMIITNIVAEDVPLDNLYSETEHRLLVDSVIASYVPPEAPGRPGIPREFWVSTNVGLFKTPTDHLVPDVFLALDVIRPTDYTIHKAYYLFHHKPPDIIVEVVSNNEGNELGSKMRKYAEWGIRYYAVYDPFGWIAPQRVYVFELRDGKYEPMTIPYFPELGLGLVEWHGVYQGEKADFLRWHDASGTLLPTMAERRAAEAERADEAASVAEFQRVRAEMAESAAVEAREAAEQERVRARQERVRAEQERRHADRLLALLRQHGIDPGPQ